jgi:hypothetical protein
MAAASEEAIKQFSALMEQLEKPLKTTFQVPICSTRCS